MDELDQARYVALTTFKKDGSPRLTPVWIAGEGGSYLFTTDGKSWKARRLGNNPSVEVQVSDMRGRVKPGATTYTGTGEVRADPDSVAAASKAIGAKYGWQFRAAQLADSVRSRLARRGKQEVVAIRLALHPPLAE